MALDPLVSKIISKHLRWAMHKGAGLAVLIIFMASFAQAGTKTWVPTNGGDWKTPGNWSPSGVPGASDDVVIPANQSAAITRSSSDGETINLNSLTINGNVNFQFDAGSQHSCTLNITGTFTVASGKTFTVGMMDIGRLNFTLASTATGTIDGTVYMNSYNRSGYDRNFTNSGDLTISGSGLLTGQNTSLFVLSSGATLRIANTSGITTTGSTGAVQIPGTRTYSTGANYVYNGIAAQSTGNGLPDKSTGSLTINNSAGVALSNAEAVANGGNIYLQAGTFSAGTRLTMGTTSTINRSEGSMTGTLQGTGRYDVIYTGNTKTTGPNS